MTPNRVGNHDLSTGQMPVTQALYGKKQRRKATPKKSNAPTRRTFALADQLDPETRQKLAALQGRLERKQSRKPRRKP
jgi:hypothetical protein